MRIRVYMKARWIFVGVVLASGACDPVDSSSVGGSTPSLTQSASVQDASRSEPGLAVRGYAESANEVGWFRLNDSATFANASRTHRCSIDRINGQKPVRDRPIGVRLGEELKVGGWVADSAMRVPSRFVIVLRSGQGTYAVNGVAGRERTDVAAAHQAESLVNSGFHSKTVLNGVRPGSYSVSLLQFEDGAYSTCVSSARLLVSE